MKNNSNYKYKFSIVMAIYNVEEYIEEAIESLINQENIDFKKDVQVILVNDGSPDNSERICLRYKELYPQNIVYIKKENGGVSSARNKGLEYVEGKYVNFLDADDKFEIDTLYKVYNFFEENYNLIDVVAIPMYFFEAKTGEHILNYVFKKSRIINILKDYNCIKLHCSSTFIKNEVIKKYQFKEGMKYAEDAHLLNKVLLEKLCYGVLNDTKYWYRSRESGTSAIQNSQKSKQWYCDSIRNFSLDLIEYSLKNLGYIPKYIQYVVMYDLQWKIKVDKLNQEILDKNDRNEFINLIKETLKYIDDNIILEQKHLWIDYKIYCLRLKYDKTFSLNKIRIKNNINFMLNDKNIYNLSDLKLRIDFIKVENKKFLIEGYLPDIDGLSDRSIDIIAKVDNKIYKSIVLDNVKRELYSLDEVISRKKYFKIEIPLKNMTEIKLFLTCDDVEVRTKPLFNKFVRLYSDMDKSYFSQNGYCVVYTNNTFTVIKETLKVKVGREFRFIQELIKKKQYKIAIIRTLVYILKNLKRKDIWLFMDRIDKADDNAEVLYKYCNTKNDGIKKYFIIKDSTDDYKRLSKTDKVISFGSYKHKMLMALSDKVISSHIDEAMRSCLHTGGKYIKNLIDFEFIFLQHGIIKDDLSNWLNKYNKNINIFITSSQQEYQSILQGDYYYKQDIVKLTGLPRYDNLKNINKKQIAIMPTWRKSIVNERNQTSGIRPYNEKFKDTNYFEYYNRLLNDKKIINIANEKGYQILFFPHPDIQQQIGDFNQNNYVSFIDYNTSYNKIFCESDLLITDYSSVAFDFAYLKKPVVYYQFDYDEVFSQGSHLYSKGYFDYETMGFGEVCYDYDKLVETVISYIESDCNMKNEYIDRVEKFYKYTDYNNCERVYNEIINM